MVKSLVFILAFIVSMQVFSQEGDSLRITIEIPAERVYSVDYRCYPPEDLDSTPEYTVLEVHNEIISISKQIIYFKETEPGESHGYRRVSDSTSSREELIQEFRNHRSVSEMEKGHAFLTYAGMVNNLQNVYMINTSKDTVGTMAYLIRDPESNSYENNQNNFFTITFFTNSKYREGEAFEIIYSADISMGLECGASFGYEIEKSGSVAPRLVKVKIQSNPSNAKVYMIPNYRWEAMFHDEFSVFFEANEGQMFSNPETLATNLESMFSLYEISSSRTPIETDCLEYVFKVIFVHTIDGETKVKASLFRPLQNAASNQLVVSFD